MVLGLRSKHRRGASVKVNYIVRVQEIRPWPPSESLRSVRTVVLHWENGDQHSGSFISAAEDSKIVFNESFKLPLILYPDKKAPGKFRKNYLEFSLFGLRKEKVKGQLLGTAVLNFADYGIIERSLSINASINFKKGSNNSVQSALIINLELDEKEGSSNSSPNVGLPKEASLDNDTDHFEVASFTDDDASSHSSRTGGSSTFEVATSSPSQVEKNGYGNAAFDPAQNKNVLPSSNDASSDRSKLINDDVSFPKFYDRSVTSVKKNSETPVIRSASFISFQDINRKPRTSVASSVLEGASHGPHEVIANNNYKTIQNTEQSEEEKAIEEFGLEAMTANNYMKNPSNSNFANSLYSLTSQEKDLQPEDVEINDAHVGMVYGEEKVEIRDDGLADQIMEVTGHPLKNKLIGKFLEDPAREKVTMMSGEAPMVPPPCSKGNRFPADTYAGEKALGPDILDGSKEKGKVGGIIGREESKAETSECRSECETRIEMLEEELREAATIEVALYSVIAEHTRSGYKVHAPARRLSRFYSNAFKAGSQTKRASAARAAVSGLVVVSKSCGNDVPRLTFWLSNSIMLRSIISQIGAELPHSNGPQSKSKDVEPEFNGILPDERAESSHVEREKSKYNEESDDWEDVMSFIIALEKVESWLFSRIVESLWWQSFTPHMQSTVAKGSGMTSGASTNRNYGRRNSLGNQEQGNFSIDLWKKAFKDACERLCPNRAGGHECGCLSVLVRLVMEQLVNRLDVAMFNAILRESDEEMPTDPLSDPISDSKVLPIPAGKSSFGAGVELKTAIGNWSRWLTDLFDLEDESTEHCGILGDDKRSKPFKAFRLLHALSDLMMLPFGMLADPSTRKEVCPLFGPTIIERVLNSFVPDEFCPDPIPQSIIGALDTEEVLEASGDMLTSIPCTASPTTYTPPPAALLTCVGEVGRQVLQSSRLPSLRKSYTSDDELDDLDSPFTSIIPDSFQSSALAKLGLMPKEKGGGKNAVRYQLLRTIWNDGD